MTRSDGIPTRARRLLPLAAAQACTAFNDNLVRNAIIVVAVFGAGKAGAGFSALAGAMFMLPYILLSATAGVVADRFPKHRVLVVAKAAEIALMALSTIAFLSGSIPGLLALLFALGVQASLSGPVKYGMLPERLSGSELVAGNGIMEAATFVAIVGGTLAGGMLITLPNGIYMVSALGISVSVLGLASALAVTGAPAAAPGIKIRANPVAETMGVLRSALSDRTARLCTLGLSWFWTVGATLVAELPSAVRDCLGGSPALLGPILAVFAAGVATGSLACSRLLKGELSPRHVPFAAVGMGIFLLDFAHVCGMGSVHGTNLLHSLSGWRALGDIFMTAACGGAFSVPLCAILQDAAEPSVRARIFAANNAVNGLFMVAGAGAVAVMSAAGMGPARVLAVTACADLLVALWIARLLPHEIYRAAFRWFFETFHGVEVSGLENYAAVDGPCVIVANHQSYLDAALLASYLPDRPVFAIHTAQARKWWVKLATAAVSTFPVDLQNPFALKSMVGALRCGARLMIFPEGRFTQTGALMKIYAGAGMVAERTGAKVVPVSIDGLQFTPWGRMAGKLRLRLFPRLRLTIHPAVDLGEGLDPAMTPRARRDAVGSRLHDALVKSAFMSEPVDKSLFTALLDARSLHGSKLEIVEDVARVPATYDRLLTASVALGRALSRLTDPQEIVGVMMPGAVGTAAAFFGLQAFRRVPAMLNFSAGSEGMLAACAAAGVRTIVSSKAFVEKGKLGPAVARMTESAPELRFVWLEDVKAEIGPVGKLRAKLDALRARRLPGAASNADNVALVLFTSGSEGLPKGVALTHRNVLSNVAQLRSVVDFTPADRVLCALPPFHSIGLVDGMLLPLLNGVKVFLYPSPLHYRAIPALAYDFDATILFGTGSFLNGWARFAHPYDFYRVRYVFAGAEKVTSETKRHYAETFGVRILEGYGVTEAAPVVAVSTPMHGRPGTVGRFLPGIDWKLEAVDGIERGGRLHVRGPNVMAGYMRAAAPGVIEAPREGWHDTGDIVAVDNGGFVTILDRAKRFAKIAGEMVSMNAAEAMATTIWPTGSHAVVRLPDGRKGERLALLTTQQGARASDLLAYARERGLPEIAVPRTVKWIEAIPLLGSGKTDYPAVQRLAEAGEAANLAPDLLDEAA